MWLRKTLKEVADNKGSKSFEEQAREKFGAEVDICLGTNYEEKGKVNSDVAVFKFDYSMFYSAEELKKLKADKLPQKLTRPKAFDLSKAERIFITKEELKQRELLEQEKLKDI